jgi:hypothetical protein
MGNTEAQRAQRRGEGRRGREEKRGEERGRERREEECTECFIAAGLALGLGELCVFAVSFGPTGRLAPFRLHFSKGWWAIACGGY